jgi:hypothetical protein
LHNYEVHIHCEMDDGLSMLGSWIVATNSFAAMSSVSNPAMAESAAPQDAPAPVDGYLSYAITVNMKVGGTLGNEDSIVVESSTLAVAKSAPAFAFGLLALDRHAHLNVLAYLRPDWVHGGGGREREKEREREEGEEWPRIGRPRVRLKKTQKPTSLVLSLAAGRAFRVDPASKKLHPELFRQK